MKRRNIRFNADLLNELIDKKYGESPGRMSELARNINKICPNSVTRQSVQLWTVGRMPRVEALYLVASHFGRKMEDFVVENNTFRLGSF